MKTETFRLILKKFLRSKTTRSIFFITLAATAGLLCFSGCKNNKKNDKVEIIFYSHKMEAHDTFEKLCKKFSEKLAGKNKNVTIKIESSGGENDYFAKLKSSFTSGKGPDIFNLSSYAEIQEWKEKIKDISSMSLIKKVAKDTLNSATDENGKILAFPECREGFGYILRKDIFEKAGVDTKTMDNFEGLEKGFETLKDAMPNLKEYPNLKAVLGVPGAESWVFGNHMIIPALNEEFSSPQEAYKSKTFEFKGKDTFKNILDFQLKFAQKDNVVGTNFQAVVDNGIYVGGYAAVQQGTWLTPTIKAYDEKNKANLMKNLVMVPYSLPKDKNKKGKFPCYVGQYFVVNKDVSQEKYKAIEEFLEYLYSDTEDGKKALEELGFITPIEGVTQNFEEGSLNDTISKAIKEENTMSGDLSVIRTEEFGSKVVGSRTQKYINNPTEKEFNDLVSYSIEKWKELSNKQLKDK